MVSYWEGGRGKFLENALPAYVVGLELKPLLKNSKKSLGGGKKIRNCTTQNTFAG